MKRFFKKHSLLLVAGIIFLAFAGLIVAKNTPQTIQNILPNQVVEGEKTVLSVQSGQATIKRGSEEIIVLENKDENVTTGDTLTTAQKSIATVRYPGGTVVRLAPDSSLTLADDNTTTNLIQTTGTIFVRFTKVLGIQEEVNVETPTAVATVRGTKLVSRIDAKLNESKFISIDHEFDVYKKDEITKKKLENTKQILKAGLQAQIGKKGVVAIAKQVLTDEEKRWIELNKDTLDGETKIDILKEIVSRYFASPSPSPKPSGTPKPTIAPVSYVQGMFGTGYNSAFVKTEAGDFKLSCYGAPQGTKVITDSASESDCKTDCPVLPLADYANRNGGVAAINGMYFCPADYPACADKKNSFDTLFFNSRVKRYLNSDNNVYSNIPFLVINADGSPRFVGRSSEWGRDTGIQAGTAGNPMLVSGGNIAVVEGNLDDKQRTVKSNRGAFVQKVPNIYLCITGGATVMDSARVYKALGVDNAINIDGGGSSALWVAGSYKYGPGRNIPTAIIFAR